MNKTATGWERLNCPFFESVVRSVLGPYFEKHGFKENSRTSTGGLVFSQRNIFVEVDYESETFPNYSPTILLGIGCDEHDQKWRLDAVPIWFVIPADRIESNYPFWTFDTETTLINVLERLCTDLLEQYAKPFWVDMPALRKSVEHFKEKSAHEARTPSARPRIP